MAHDGAAVLEAVGDGGDHLRSLVEPKRRDALRAVLGAVHTDRVRVQGEDRHREGNSPLHEDVDRSPQEDRITRRSDVLEPNQGTVSFGSVGCEGAEEHVGPGDVPIAFGEERVRRFREVGQVVGANSPRELSAVLGDDRAERRRHHRIVDGDRHDLVRVAGCGAVELGALVAHLDHRARVEESGSEAVPAGGQPVPELPDVETRPHDRGGPADDVVEEHRRDRLVERRAHVEHAAEGRRHAGGVLTDRQTGDRAEVSEQIRRQDGVGLADRRPRPRRVVQHQHRQRRPLRQCGRRRRRSRSRSRHDRRRAVRRREGIGSPTDAQHHGGDDRHCTDRRHCGDAPHQCSSPAAHCARSTRSAALPCGV